MNQWSKTVWSEGMFLSPHHFQQWDAHYSHLLDARFQAAQHFPYGVIDVSLDPDTLTNGQVAISSFRAVMPDGTLVSMPGQDLLPAGRSLEQAFPASLPHLDVFVGVPLLQSDGGNCRLGNSPSPRPQRYVSEFIKASDHNTGENVREIAVARVQGFLFFGNEETASYTTIKVAEVVRVPRGTYALRDAYIPPCLAVSASPALTKLLRGLLEILFAKRNTLVAHQRPAGELGLVDVAKFSLLHTVNRSLPVLAHFAREGKLHPETLYLTLARLVGELASVAPQIDLREIPAYQHTNLTDTFRGLELRIREVIEGLTTTTYVTVPLTLVRDNLWSGSVTDDGLLKAGEFYLVASGDLPEDQLRDVTPKRLKVGGAEDIDLIVNRALPGVRLTYVARPPSEFPVRPGSMYFRLENQGEFWEAIRRNHAISVNVPSVLKGLKVEILATRA